MIINFRSYEYRNFKSFLSNNRKILLHQSSVIMLIYFVTLKMSFCERIHSCAFFLMYLRKAYIIRDIAVKRKNIRLLLMLLVSAFCIANTKHPSATIIQTISRKWMGFLFIFFYFKSSTGFFYSPVSEILVCFHSFPMNYSIRRFNPDISVCMDDFFCFVPYKVFCV